MKTTLIKQDFNTAVWATLEKDLQAELQRLREQNDANLDDLATAKLRGRIEQIKDLLALNKSLVSFKPASNV
jgi:hypothetical protein